MLMCIRHLLHTPQYPTMSCNPWCSNFTTLPSRAGSSRGLVHVLATSECLGQTPAGPSERSDVQAFCEALVQHANVDHACAARQAESEQELADANVSVIVGNRQQVQLLTDASNSVSTLLKQKEPVIQRLQQPSCGPSLIVENPGQQALSNMLQEAALQPEGSSCRAHAIEWANHFREAPATWSAMLQPASDAATAMNLYHHGLNKAFEATRDLSGSVYGNETQ